MKTQHIFLGLLLIFLGAFIYFFNAHNKSVAENTVLKQEKSELSTQLEEVELFKKNLEKEVDSLTNNYYLLIEENENLEKYLAGKTAQLIRNEAEIRKIKEESSNEIGNLKKQLDELFKLKSELVTSIKVVTIKNDSLKTEVAIKEGRLEINENTRKKLVKKNMELADENEQWMLKNFKASAFRVELESKNGKLAAKAKRAKRVKVSFDLDDVPAKYQSLKPLYLVIKDAKHQPIFSETYYPVSISRNGESMNIKAVQRQSKDLEDEQRIFFEYEFAGKLESGYYRVEIFTDIALLGVTSFRAG